MRKSLFICIFPLAAMAVAVADDPPCNAPDPACTAPARWFQLPPIESDYHEPTKGIECEFYQFAWQTFLYIVQPNEYESLPKFLGYHTPAQLFGAEAAPRFPAIARATNKSEYRLLLTPRLEKLPNQKESLSSVTQAVSHSTLIDQNGRAVYYAQHVNKRFEDFVHQFIRDPKTGKLDPARL
jgi:hypothetical protein